jgi:hypothetical protein
MRIVSIDKATHPQLFVLAALPGFERLVRVCQAFFPLLWRQLMGSGEEGSLGGAGTGETHLCGLAGGVERFPGVVHLSGVPSLKGITAFLRGKAVQRLPWALEGRGVRCQTKAF